MTPLEILAAIAGAALAIAGAWVFALVRRTSDDAPPRARLRCPGVGTLSEVSHAVIGLSLVVAGFQVFVHAIDADVLRVPWPLALAGAAFAAAATIGVDALERRPDPDGQ